MHRLLRVGKDIIEVPRPFTSARIKKFLLKASFCWLFTGNSAEQDFSLHFGMWRGRALVSADPFSLLIGSFKICNLCKYIP